MVGKNKRKRNNKKNALKKANLLETKGQEERQDFEGEGDENEEDERPAKRIYNEEDSDTEDKPKMKKKKKQPITEAGDKKGKQSIRQMKREKHSLRLAQMDALTKDQLKSQCLNYLSQWKHDKQNWKFMKSKQVWLFKNKFSTFIDDSSWKTLLEYFESAQGNIRNLLLDDANKIIKQMDEWTESQKEKKKQSTENEDETTDESKVPEITKPDDIAYKRARDLIQCLH